MRAVIIMAMMVECTDLLYLATKMVAYNNNSVCLAAAAAVAVFENDVVKMTMRIAATRPRLPDLLSAYLYLLQSFPAPVIVRRPQVSWPGVVIRVSS
jgi:hypothetical protein